MAVTLDLNTLSDINPQTLYHHAYSPHCLPYISHGTDDENLLSNQDLCHLLIISFFLMIYMFD